MDDFAAMVDSLRSDWQTPGLAVAVVKGDSVVFAEGFGYADQQQRLPVDPQTVFLIGSATKSFTATLAAMLVDDGVLDLDEPLVERVPELRLPDGDGNEQVTLRDLLCHRAGLTGQSDMLWLIKRMDLGETVRNVRHLGRGASFRDQFLYSNLGYTLVGAVMEQVTGASWEDLIRERILVPLGMEHTGFGVPVTGARAKMAAASRVVNDDVAWIPLSGTVGFDNVATVGPAGSMRSNLDDMTQWLGFQLRRGIDGGGRRLVSERSLAETHGPQMAIRDPGYRKLLQADVYGFGWTLADYAGHRILAHGGNIEGYSSIVSFMPDQNLGVVVLSNGMDLLGHVISRNVYDRFLEIEEQDWNSPLKQIMVQLRQSLEIARIPPPSDPEAPVPWPLTAYEGLFRHPLFGSVSVSRHNGALTLVFDSGLRSELHSVRLDQFRGITDELYLPGFDVVFETDDQGLAKALLLTLQPGVDGLEFVREATHSAASRRGARCGSADR